MWKVQGKLHDLMETLKSINSNAPSPNTIKLVLEDKEVGALGITENQILLLQTYSRTSRISTAPETLFDNPVHKGVSRGSDGASEAGDNVGDLNNVFKRMFNPLYIIECH